MTTCSTNTTADVQNSTTGFELADVQQEVDEVDLTLLFGLGRRLEISMMNVLAPEGSLAGLIQGYAVKVHGAPKDSGRPKDRSRQS
jgi:hypothetical protein